MCVLLRMRVVVCACYVVASKIQLFCKEGSLLVQNDFTRPYTDLIIKHQQLFVSRDNMGSCGSCFVTLRRCFEWGVLQFKTELTWRTNKYN